MQQRKR